MSQPQCPKCQSPHAYPDRDLWICPECAHEWNATSPEAPSVAAPTEDDTVRDAHGTPLADGDSVIVLKDLKIKGASSAIKGGTKVKSIRLSPGHDGHNISCRIEGVGSIQLKSEFVKKA